MCSKLGVGRSAFEVRFSPRNADGPLCVCVCVWAMVGAGMQLTRRKGEATPLAPGPHPKGFLPFGPVIVIVCLLSAGLGAGLAAGILGGFILLDRGSMSPAQMAWAIYGAAAGASAGLFWCAWMKHRTVHRYRDSGDLIAVGMVAGIGACALFAAIGALAMCILGDFRLALRFLASVPGSVFPGPLLGLPGGFLWWMAAALWYPFHKPPSNVLRS